MDIEFLTYIRKLGNGAVHPNKGDYEKQKVLDNQLIELVDVIFSRLLDRIYEEPNRVNQWDSIFKEKVKLISEKK